MQKGEEQAAAWRLESAETPPRLILCGDWLMGRPQPRARDVLEEVRRAGVEEAAVEASAVGRWDSTLMAFLVRLEDRSKEFGIQVPRERLPENIRALLELSEAVPEQEASSDARQSWSIVRRVGEKAIELGCDCGQFATFVGQIVLSLGRLVRGKAQMRMRDFWVALEDVSISALPIVSLISFLVGLIIAFLGAVVLRQFGASYYVSYLMGYGMLREMGAVMTSIIMAGRTGAAFAAEIGSMKASEEIDALKTLGISPIDYLVLPRTMALSLAMPVLTVYSYYVGIFGGLLISVSMLDVPSNQFFDGLREVVGLNDFFLGVFKGGTFGVIIALAGCLRGIQSGANADAVGRATTSAVVTAITLIIFANAVIDWAAAMFNI